MSILQQLHPLITQFRPPEYFTSYVECFVVFVSHRWSAILTTIFLTLTTCYSYQHEPICLSKFDRSEVADDMFDICVTYPFTVQEKEDRSTYRSYILHYKWMPYVMGLILGFFLLLQIVIKKMRDPKVVKLLESMTATNSEDERYIICCRYFSEHIGRHANLPYARTKVLFSCLAIHGVIFFVLDMTLAGYYAHLPLHLFNIRDMENFSDPMSVVMSPFVQCELAPNMQLWLDRSEQIGCYLPLMELYDKILVSFWLWQMCCGVLIVVSLLVHHFYLPKYPHLLPHRPLASSYTLRSNTSRGDVLLLQKVKPLITAADLQNLVDALAQILHDRMAYV